MDDFKTEDIYGGHLKVTPFKAEVMECLSHCDKVLRVRIISNSESALADIKSPMVSTTMVWGAIKDLRRFQFMEYLQAK